MAFTLLFLYNRAMPIVIKNIGEIREDIVLSEKSPNITIKYKKP